MKYLMGLFPVLIPTAILAQQATPNSQLLQQLERRQAMIDEQLIPSTQGNFQPSTARQAKQPNDTSAPCFPIPSVAK